MGAGAAMLTLPLPPETAVCLCCTWAPLPGEHGGTAATAHTWATRHPTVYRPPADGPDRDQVPAADPAAVRHAMKPTTDRRDKTVGRA
jgi:hypothetical protein